MSEILISLTGKQKNLYVFVNVFHLPFHPDLSSTNVTSITSSMCLFMCKRHLKHCFVKCVENDSRKKNEIAKRMQNEHKHNLVPCKRHPDSRHLLQNPTVPNYVMRFRNCAKKFTPLNCLSKDSPLETQRFQLW